MTPSPNPESIGDDVVERAALAMIVSQAEAEGANSEDAQQQWNEASDEDRGHMLRIARAAVSTLDADEGLRLSILKVRDGYASQLKFCDIEAHSYFREFIRRINAALNSTHGIESRD